MINTQDMTPEQVQELVAKLTAENHALKNKAVGGLKVSEKGAISLYGLQRFPVTLYASAWEKLLDKCDEIRAFIKENEGKIARKPEQDQVKVA